MVDIFLTYFSVDHLTGNSSVQLRRGCSPFNCSASTCSAGPFQSWLAVRSITTDLVQQTCSRSPCPPKMKSDVRSPV